MPRKKLSHYKVLRVEQLEATDTIFKSLQPVSLDALRDPHDAPDGTFITHLSTLILPKRKRGTKFIITYTRIFQQEL
jgi:hypothetical protein